MSQQSEVAVRREDDQNRYVATVEGAEAGVCQYSDDGETRTFTHTIVDGAFEGRGVGSALARAALDGAREDGKRIIAECSFIKSYLTKHDDWNDLVA